MSTTQNVVAAWEPQPEICEPGGHGIVLPLLEAEQEIDSIIRGIIYLVLLGWCFLGVSIISDIFMEGIEAVTAKRRTWRLANGQEITTKVWNDTVANLSLMALGSSAPEIMLNVLEIVLREFFSGDLGPSTIVGSAAFNLMVIIAVCVYVIPDGQARQIESLEPFLVTAFFSIAAYLWMLVVISWTTPDVITILEAVITLCLFPTLILVAYAADVGCFSCGKQEDEDDDHVEFIKEKVIEAGFDLTTDETKKLKRLKTAELAGAKSRMQTKIDANPLAHHKLPKQELSIGFVSAKYLFSSECSEMVLTVEKRGENADLVKNARVVFEYKTTDGPNMRADDYDYIPQSSEFGEIPSGERCGQIVISRKPQKVSDVMNGGDPSKKAPAQAGAGRNVSRFFHVELAHAAKVPVHRRSLLGKHNYNIEEESRRGMAVHMRPEVRRIQVHVGSIQGSGQLRLESSEVDVPFPEHDTICRVKVRRIGGSDGTLQCNFYTMEHKGDSAKAGSDYIRVEGRLEFSPGVAEQVIEVPIMKKLDPSTQDKFTVVIAEVFNRAKCIVKGEETCSIKIWDDGSSGIADKQKVLRALDSTFNVDQVLDSARDWADQFVTALNPRGGDEDDAESASVSEWTMHFISLPWKLIFACVPPPSYCGGWLCFFFALLMIGGVTVFIGDLATLIGCVMDIHGSITAITIVALGTSLPDTFASKVAAVEDPTADAAIGNVTGSNSVNVFLGLGLPWVVGSLYWEGTGKTAQWIYKYPLQHAAYAKAHLVVVGGDLSFSVTCFTICSICVLGTIWYRRKVFEAELGGPAGAKMNTTIFLVLLWMFYVSMASWKVIHGDVDAGIAALALVAGLVFVGVGMVIVSFFIKYAGFAMESRRQEFKDILAEVSEKSRTRSSWAMANQGTSWELPVHYGDIAKGVGGLRFPAFEALRQIEVPEGYLMKAPEAVEALRKQVEALYIVCVSLENQFKVPDRTTSDSSTSPTSVVPVEASPRAVKKVPQVPISSYIVPIMEEQPRNGYNRSQDGQQLQVNMRQSLTGSSIDTPTTNSRGSQRGSGLFTKLQEEGSDLEAGWSQAGSIQKIRESQAGWSQPGDDDRSIVRSIKSTPAGKKKRMKAKKTSSPAPPQAMATNPSLPEDDLNTQGVGFDKEVSPS